jgi:hypothetical protein
MQHKTRMLLGARGNKCAKMISSRERKKASGFTRAEESRERAERAACGSFLLFVVLGY